MISGRNKPAEYASRENLTPGKTSSVMQAPPTIRRRSRTRTFNPAFARYAAETRPLWPPPTTTASHAPSTAHGARDTYVSLLALARNLFDGSGVGVRPSLMLLHENIR